MDGWEVGLGRRELIPHSNLPNFHTGTQGAWEHLEMKEKKIGGGKDCDSMLGKPKLM